MNTTTAALKSLLNILPSKLNSLESSKELGTLPGCSFLTNGLSKLLAYEGTPSNSLNEKITGLSNLLKTIAGETKPKCLSPWELLKATPSLTKEEFCSEIIWLYYT